MCPEAPALSLVDRGSLSPQVQQHGQLAWPGTGKWMRHVFWEGCQAYLARLGSGQVVTLLELCCPVLGFLSPVETSR